MRIGFIGLPKSGKTTLFNALTGSSATVSAFATGRLGPNLASVKVSDERVEKLAVIYKPQRQVYPAIDIVDLAGINEGDGRADAFSGDLMKLARTVDALAIVLRNFQTEASSWQVPLEDLKKIEQELLLADLIIAEKRLEKVEAGLKKGSGGSGGASGLKAEQQVLKIVVEALNEGRPLRELEFDENQKLITRCFQFLTQKPAMVILNSGEASTGKNQDVLQVVSQRYRSVEFAGQLEMELSQLDIESARAFMEDLGIKESARDRLIALAYEALGYISFFTVGPDEVRAWNIKRGATALEAAAAIHTDLARGFIAAECFNYDDLIVAGSDKEVRSHGQFKLVGKDYMVRDGDILSIRFHI
ncbi:MAG: DUF933 domain-containing protein [Acidobacteriota bacterium]|nr:DUF933 domain-containing protein [Acidobacteriota bacterium]